LVATKTKKVGSRQGVAILEGGVEYVPRPIVAIGHIARDHGTVTRFYGGDKSPPIGEVTVANFTAKWLCDKFALPRIVLLAIKKPSSLHAGDKKFIFGVLVPVNGVKVVTVMKEVADESGGPLVLARILRHLVGQHLETVAFIVSVALSGQGLDH
jgi:hypothetical protein